MIALVEHTRGSVREVVHQGAISVKSSNEKGISIGSVDELVALRSTAKPFILGALLDGPLADENFSDREISAMASSHNGEPEHVSVVVGLLTRFGIANELLRCGVHEQWHQSSIRSTIGNNCSGKHTAFLIAEKLAGEPLDNYWDPTSKIQKFVLERLEKMLPGRRIGVEIDGCSVPTFVVSLEALSQLFLEYALDRLGSGVAKVRNAHLSAPFYMSGTDRLEGYLLQNYSISAKSGSDGVWALGWNRFEIGLAGKTWSGSEAAIQHAILHVLQSEYSLPVAQDKYLQNYFDRDRFDLTGQRIGKVQTCFRT